MFTTLPPVPGFDSVNSAVYIAGVGNDSDGLSDRWGSQVESMFGRNREASDVSITAEREANKSIVYAHTIVPWADGTHRLIQPGMLVFNSRYVDPRYKLTNMAPVFKLNIMIRKCYNDFVSPQGGVQSPEALRFAGYLQLYGERGLEHYHNYLRGRITDLGASANDLKDFYTLHTKPAFWGLTKWGIRQNWNFCGSVLSKGESTGAGAYLDHHEASDTTYVAGVVHGEGGRVHDVWGGAYKAGTHLFLILKRSMNSNGAYRHFEWVPYSTSNREYPPRHEIYYEDDSEGMCRAYVQYIGLCTEKKERDAGKGQVELAMGLLDGDVKKASDAYGILPQIVVQLGI